MRRYPLSPLMAAAQIATMAELRRMFPMNGTDYRRVLDDGLTETQADRCSVRLGLVPWEVWPDWFEDEYRECAASDCDTRFVPAQAHQRFCRSSCSSRQRRRDRYASDPLYAKRRKAEARRYYEQHGELVRERNREAKAAERRRRGGNPHASDGEVAA